MAIVTQIKQNVKNKNKVSVFAYGIFLCSVTAESIVKHRVKVGDEIDENKLKTVLDESDRETAFQKAVDCVCRSMKTQKQTEDYLYKKGFSAEVVQTTVAKMQEYRYIDDGEFVKSYVMTYKNAKGKKRIEYELKLKGVAQEHIDKVEQLLDDQTESVNNVAAKFMKNRQPTKDNLQKLFRHLAGRGFDFDLCRNCVKTFAAAAENEDEFIE